MNYSEDRLLIGSDREGQTARFRHWILLVVPLCAILFQIYIPLFFEFLTFLELPLLVTVYFSLMRRSPMGGIAIGALVGLAQDSLSKNPLGMLGIVKTLVGYFAASVGLRFDVDHTFVRFALCFFFFLFHQFFYWVLARALLGQELALEVSRMMLTGVLNAAVGVSLFYFLDKLRARG